MSTTEKMKSLAPKILRIGMSLEFLWFGSQQLLHTDAWTSLIPQWVISLSGMTAVTLVHFNGAFEIVFGLCLLFGFYTQVVAFFLALHLLDITFTVGYTSIGVRDLALSIATISVFLYGVDSWCVDSHLPKDDKYAIN